MDCLSTGAHRGGSEWLRGQLCCSTAFFSAHGRRSTRDPILSSVFLSDAGSCFVRAHPAHVAALLQENSRTVGRCAPGPVKGNRDCFDGSAIARVPSAGSRSTARSVRFHLRDYKEREQVPMTALLRSGTPHAPPPTPDPRRSAHGTRVAEPRHSRPDACTRTPPRARAPGA